MFATEQDLPVALWIDTPALGDTIAATPTLRKLSKAFNDLPLTVFTSNPSLFDGHPLVYHALPLDAPKDGFKVYHTFWPLVGKTYDLSGSKVEFRHSNTDIRQFHAMSLGFSLAQDELEMELYCEQEYELPFTDYVIIHPTHTWPTRTWSQEKWQELVDRLNAKGIPVVAVGKDSAEVGTFNVQKPVMNVEIKLGINLLNNPEINIAVLRWMMNHRAKAVVTMDSGILHVAGTTDVEIIQLGSSIDWRLRAPYRKGTQDYKYHYVAGGCDIMCTSNMKYNSRVHGSIHGVPPQIHCLENKPTFECHPTVDQVIDIILKQYTHNMNVNPEGIDYDFIEIGTSDFQTLIEEASDSDVGLSIEPISYYLNRLPDRKNVTKVQAAMSDQDGQLDIYYIQDKEIEANGLPWWVRGSNSINKPHPFTVQEIGQELYDKLVTIEPVPVIGWDTLIEKYQIKSIKYLKVDTEGHDHVILNAYLDICEQRPELLADRIKFECHYAVSNIEEIEKLLTRFKGYDIRKDVSDYILTKKNQIPRIIHQTYSTGDLPAPLRLTTEAVKNQNPTFEYRFYDDADCINFIRENYDQETLDLYLRINPSYGAARADFFRYLLMYKCGGVYLDVKSVTTEPLENTLLDTDEFILTHWEGRDFAKELNYEFGEFQNWHIICVPRHPFLKNVIEIVKDNIRNLKDGHGKEGVLNITGPIPYSQGILKDLHKHKTNFINSPVREFRFEHEVGLKYMGTDEHHAYTYENEHYSALTEPVLTNSKHKKAYVYYGSEAYVETIKASILALREFSNLPVYVYMLNTDAKINLPGVTCIECSSIGGKQEVGVVTADSGNYFINREDKNVYNILIERPNVVKHALDNFAEMVTYIDADSVAMPWVDQIFDMYVPGSGFPYFTTGIHDYLHLGGRGGAMTKEDLSTTLEHEACELFGVNQKVREIYRQSGYFVADQSCKMFLEEWSWMCKHPKILADFTRYAPYHEETIMNVLFWKYNILFEALPLVYVNGSVDTPKLLSGIGFTGDYQQLDGWTKVPGNIGQIMFIHGEKRPEAIAQITEEIKKHILWRR